MINRWQVTTIVALGVAFAVAIEGVYNSEFYFGVLLRILMAAAIVNALISVFDHHLWKWGWLHGWFVHRPIIAGAWDVTIMPLTDDPAIGKPRPRRKYRYQVHQTYSTLFIRMLDGPESESETISAELRRGEDGGFELIATYRNVPRMKVRERSEIHFGTVKLRLDGDRMTGSYWTDRPTKGEVEAVKRAETTTGISE